MSFLRPWRVCWMHLIVLRRCGSYFISVLEETFPLKSLPFIVYRVMHCGKVLTTCVVENLIPITFSFLSFNSLFSQITFPDNWKEHTVDLCMIAVLLLKQVPRLKWNAKTARHRNSYTALALQQTRKENTKSR